MMIASPTAASAAATVITKNTNTCPPMPYCCAKAMKLRFTALSMSSTHMDTMIALRRINTPIRPITKSTAEKKSASASIFFPALFAEHHRADDRREQQDARDLEGEQVFVEERRGDRRDRPGLRDFPGRESLRKGQRRGCACLGVREGLRKDREHDREGSGLPHET